MASSTKKSRKNSDEAVNVLAEAAETPALTAEETVKAALATNVDEVPKTVKVVRRRKAVNTVSETQTAETEERAVRTRRRVAEAASAAPAEGAAPKVRRRRKAADEGLAQLDA